MDSTYNLIEPKEKRKKKIPAKYIISYKSQNKTRWDNMVVIMAIYNAMIIPF